MQGLRLINLLFSVTVMIAALTGCTKDMDAPNLKPTLTVISEVDGLKVILKGSALDTDGSVTELTVDWENDNHMNLPATAYANFEVSHLFSEPASYNIKITAIDNEGDTTIQLIPLNLDFKETSLSGIKESMFKKSGNEFLILTVNLHTYQESQQNEKFRLLTDVIGKMDIDFIAFQECAQNKSTAITTGIIRKDNMALIISTQMKEKYQTDYNFVWNWAHYGWDVWEEGVSVLSRHPLTHSEDRFISSNTSTGSITSRKVIYGSYQTPKGAINLFSGHTHWRTSVSDEEQNNQIKNIKAMVAEKELLTPEAATFVCGDLNGNSTSDYPWSEGYNTMMRNNDYSDTFFDIYPEANSKPAQSQYFTIGGDLPGRIDYIFMKKNAHYKVVDSQIIFKSDVVGKISDHYGVLTKVEFIQ